MQNPNNLKNNICYITETDGESFSQKISDRLLEYKLNEETNESNIEALAQAVAILSNIETVINKGQKKFYNPAELVLFHIHNLMYALPLVCFENEHFFLEQPNYLKEAGKIYPKGLEFLYTLDGYSPNTEHIFYFILSELLEITNASKTDIVEIIGEEYMPEAIEIRDEAEKARSHVEEYLKNYIQMIDEEMHSENENEDPFADVRELESINEEKDFEKLKNLSQRELYEKADIKDLCQLFLDEWNPPKIAEYLNRYIAGQQKAIDVFSQMVYEHVVRVANPDKNIKKSNYVMFGPTGCGKTEMVKIASHILPIPIEIVDSSSITSQGFKGMDKEDLFAQLIEKYKDKIEYAIIILDEFDKLCYKRTTSSGDDVNKSIQFDLLKMIEGTTLYIRITSAQITIPISTENITFVCSGSFDGAFSEDIKNAFGFGATSIDRNQNKTIMECLVDFGMVPEFAGRISALIPVKQLSKDDLYEILAVKENNCIDSIKNLYKCGYKKDLSFSNDTLWKICDVALKQKLGARGLQGIVETVCHNNLDLSSIVKESKLDITPEMVSDVYDVLDANKQQYSR